MTSQEQKRGLATLREDCEDDRIPFVEDSIPKNYLSTSINLDNEKDGGQRPPVPRARSRSFRNFRSASLTVSLIEKFSDDRQAPTVLAGWNVSNLIQGTGILGVPFAVQQGGWAAIAAIFIVAFMCCHTGKLLVDCLYEESPKSKLRKRVRVSYAEVGEAVFPRFGFALVNAVQVCEMFGAVVMYIVLLGTVLTSVFDSLLPNMTSSEWAAISCLLCLPALFIRRMSIISWFSMLAVFCLMASIVVMVAFCLTQTGVWQLGNIPAFDPQTFPVGLGIVVFSYCAHAVFPSIENSMKHPENYNPMLNWSFLVAAFSKTFLGAFMVLTFSNDTNEVATINLQGSPIFYKLVTILVLLNVLLVVPLGMFVVSMTWDDVMMHRFPHLGPESGYHWLWLLITRPMLLIGSLFIALIVPHFGLLMSLIGSFTGTMLCFVFPCIFHMKLKWKSLSRPHIALQIIIVIFGVIAGVFGVYFSGRRLIKRQF